MEHLGGSDVDAQAMHASVVVGVVGVMEKAVGVVGVGVGVVEMVVE